MSWIRNSAIAAALLVSAGAAAAATLVVRSSGPSAATYPAGKSLADGTAIMLKAGDQLTLLDGRGTRVLRGPGSFSPSGATASADTGTRFAALVGSGGSDRRVRIGAVRGLGVTPHAPNLWYVDVSKPGTICVADPSSVTLWRPRADSDQSLTVTGPKGATSTIPWPSGSATLPWPDKPAAAPGTDYTLTLSGGGATKVKLASLGMKPTGLEDTAGALIRAGCSGQLDLLVNTFAVSSDGGTGGN